jgi:hypothetical protein
LIPTVGKCVGWIALGFLTGVVLNYYLYRIGLPIEPFIYQAF